METSSGCIVLLKGRQGVMELIVDVERAQTLKLVLSEEGSYKGVGRLGLNFFFIDPILVL